MGALEELVVALGFDYRGDGDARRFQQELKRTESGLQSFAANAGKIAAAAGAALATAFTGLSVSAGRAAIDFEDQMTEIQKKAGATAEQMAKVRDQILTLAEGGEVASSIEEISAAFERGAAAGLPLDGLRDFALLSTKAADAFGMSAEQVGNAFAGFEKVLGVPRAELERVADLINHLADSGIADESDIVTFMDSVGAMAKTVGLSVEETAAFGAALANLKVPAGEAATAMNAILTKLVAPEALSGKATGAMKDLVGDVDAFARALSEDADTAILGLIDRLKGLDAAERAGTIANIFGMEHVDVVSQMVEGSGELRRNLHEAGEESLWLGSLQKSYNLKLDDTSSKMKIFWNGLKGWLISIGDRGLPILNRALDTVRDLMTRLRRDGTLDKVADGFESIWLTAEHLAIQSYRIGRGFYYAADGVAALLAKATGLPKALAGVAAGAGALGMTKIGRSLMMGAIGQLARKSPLIMAALAIDDIVSELNGDESYIGELEGGKEAVAAIKKNFEDARRAADGLAGTINDVFGFGREAGQTQIDALLAGIKSFAQGEYVKAVEDLAGAVQGLADNLRTISDVLKNPEAAFQRFADAAIAQIDRIIAYLDNRFGGALSALQLRPTNEGEIVGSDGTVFKDGGVGEKQSRKALSLRESIVGRAFLGDPEDPATSRVSGGWDATKGNGSASASVTPGNLMELGDRVITTIKVLPDIIRTLLGSAPRVDSSFNAEQMAQGLENIRARLESMNGTQASQSIQSTIAPQDNRQFPVTVNSTVNQTIQQSTQAPAAAARAVAAAIAQASTPARIRGGAAAPVPARLQGSAGTP